MRPDIAKMMIQCGLHFMNFDGIGNIGSVIYPPNTVLEELNNNKKHIDRKYWTQWIADAYECTVQDVQIDAAKAII